MAEPEALALIEFASIALGTRAVDALIKKAPVALERLGTLQPGIMAVLFSGDVASVEIAHAEALRVGAAGLRDQVLLPYVHPAVVRAAAGHIDDWSGDTIGVVETCSLSGAIHGADVAVKGALVRVVQIRLGDELGGKGLVYLAGEQHDVEAALELVAERAAEAVDPKGGRRPRSVITSLTPRFDDELRAHLQGGTRFWSDPGAGGRAAGAAATGEQGDG